MLRGMEVRGRMPVRRAVAAADVAAAHAQAQVHPLAAARQALRAAPGLRMNRLRAARHLLEVHTLVSVGHGGSIGRIARAVDRG